MQMILVLATVLSVAVAQEFVEADQARYQPGSDREAEIVASDFEINEDGSYSANFETSNGISAKSDGISYPGSEPETGNFVMTGEYAYTSPEGKQILVRWTADENGYVAESDDEGLIPKLAPDHQKLIDDSINGQFE